MKRLWENHFKANIKSCEMAQKQEKYSLSSQDYIGRFTPKTCIPYYEINNFYIVDLKKVFITSILDNTF